MHVRIKNHDPLIHKLFMQTLLVMIIAELASSVAIMLDGIIISRFFSKYAVAAYGLSAPYTNMLKMLGSFFATGTQVVYSQYAAKGLHRKANEAFTVSVVIMAFFSCLAALAIFVFSDQLALLLGASKDAAHLQQYTSDYLRGLAVGLPVNLGVFLLMPLINIDGDKKRIAISINVMLVVNTAGDLFVAIFMNGNIFGLALVTSISYLCALTVLLLHFRKGSSIHLVRSDNPLVLFSEISKTGVIPAVTRFFSMIRAYALNIIFITFAGAGVLAANTLVQSNIKTVPMCVARAIGTSVLAISGVLYEERDKRGLCQLFRSVLIISFGPCLLIAALVFVLAPQIVALFGARDISALTVLALRCYIVGLPLIGVKMFFIYYFQAARKKLLSYYSSAAGEMVFLVAFAVVRGKTLGEIGLFLAFPVSEILYIISVVLIAWIREGHFPCSIDDFLFLDSQFEVEENKVMDVSVHSRDEVVELSDRAISFCVENGYDPQNAYYVGLAVEELGRNIFEHGADDGKKHFVDMKVIVHDDGIFLRLRDNCRQFNPRERADMITSDPKQNIGIRIVSQISRTMDYNNLFNLNQLTIKI